MNPPDLPVPRSFAPRSSAPPILHPFLFALYPWVSLYAWNLAEVRFTDTLRVLGVSLAAAVALVGVFRALSKGWHRAGLAASLALGLFFSFGHVYRWLFLNLPPGALLARANVLMAVWMSALILGVWAILRLLKRPRRYTLPVNTAGAAAVLVAAVPLVLSLAGTARAATSALKHPSSLAPQPGPAWDGARPDIYYIILDGYGRSDVLREFYGVDNSDFLEGLERRGFRVTSGSSANYWKTPLSLASSLNFHYLDELMTLDPTSNDSRPLEDLIRHSAARAFLEGQGYRFVSFSSEFPFSDIPDADRYVANIKPVNPFEVNLMIGSMGIFWADAMVPVYHRQEIRHHFDQLARMAQETGPKFVFVHLVMPHPPFVFDAQGRPVTPSGGSDGNAYSGGVDHYLKGYAGQVVYASRLVEEALDRLMRESASPPVILLQGDHGPGAYLNWQSVEASCLRERFPILSAYAFPGREDALAALPEDITPVNSFRALFNAYFDADLPLEPNRHYAVHWENYYRLYDVTGGLEACPVDIHPVGAAQP